MITALAPVLLLALFPASLSRETFIAKVVAVHDGDTLSVLRDGRERLRVRLEGIDCPELHQDFGRRAKQTTAHLAFGRTVSVRTVDRDAYGRPVVRILVAGEDLSLALVRAGMAWHYKRHSTDATLAEAERQARTQRLGLWSQPRPRPPWEWRAQFSRR